MIKYYAYYSFGGYKDLFLGSSDDKSDFSYYSPFLSMWREGAIESEEQRTQLEALSHLPQMHVLDYSSPLPQIARGLVSNGGYKIALAHDADHYVLVVRDILGSEKDEIGRPIPFVLYFISPDFTALAKLTQYLYDNINELNLLLGPIFAYDPQYNCLRCNVALLRELTHEAVDMEQMPPLGEFRTRSIVMAVANSIANFKLLADNLHVSSHGPVFNNWHQEIMAPSYSAHTNHGASQRATGPESTCTEIDIYRGVKSSDKITIEGILNYIRTFFKLTDADKEDFAAIKRALANIYSRRS